MVRTVRLLKEWVELGTQGVKMIEVAVKARTAMTRETSQTFWIFFCDFLQWRRKINIGIFLAFASLLPVSLSIESMLRVALTVLYLNRSRNSCNRSSFVYATF